MSFTPGPDTVGEIEPLSLWSGQGVAVVRKVQQGANVIQELLDEIDARQRQEDLDRPQFHILQSKHTS